MLDCYLSCAFVCRLCANNIRQRILSGAGLGWGVGGKVSDDVSLALLVTSVPGKGEAVSQLAACPKLLRLDSSSMQSGDAVVAAGSPFGALAHAHFFNCAIAGVVSKVLPAHM